MKPLSVYWLLMLIIITSFESYSQYQDTIKYEYNASGSRIERIFILGGDGGKGTQDSEVTKKEETEVDAKTDVFNDQIGNNSIRIYPNPTKSSVTIEIQGLEENRGDMIFLIDQMGRVVQNITVVTYSNTLDLSNLTPGIYFMVIKLKNGTTKWSIIKEQ